MKAKALVLIIAGMVMLAGMSVADQPTKKQNKGAEKIELFGGKKGKIPFPHHTHQDVLKDCNICHADFPQKAGSIEALKAEGKLKKKQVMNKQCIKCHKKKKRAKERTGPTSCSKCHQKDS